MQLDIDIWHKKSILSQLELNIFQFFEKIKPTFVQPIDKDLFFVTVYITDSVTLEVGEEDQDPKIYNWRLWWNVASRGSWVWWDRGETHSSYRRENQVIINFFESMFSVHPIKSEEHAKIISS